MAACEVLVEHNNRRQVIKFYHSEELSDVIMLSNEVIKVFKVEGTFVIQMKREEWGGEFVDVIGDELIPEHSIVRVVQVDNISSCSERGSAPMEVENTGSCSDHGSPS